MAGIALRAIVIKPPRSSPRAFGAVLDRARDAVASLTRAVEPGRGGVLLATLAIDSALKRSFKDLRSTAKSYVKKANAAKVNEPTSRVFADAVAAADNSEATIFGYAEFTTFNSR